MLKVLRNNKFTWTKKADADRRRYDTALAAVSNKVFMIAGYVYVNGYSSTVSCYDIASDTWEGLNAKLNIARSGHSACALKKMIYVFSGCNGDYKRLNSIEVISETSLVKNNIYMANHRGAYENLDLT